MIHYQELDTPTNTSMSLLGGLDVWDRNMGDDGVVVEGVVGQRFTYTGISYRRRDLHPPCTLGEPAFVKII